MTPLNSVPVSVIEHMDGHRAANGYHTIEELITVIGARNTIIDPFSVLISRNVTIGRGNTISSGVAFIADSSSTMRIGDNNLFSNNTRLEAANAASIILGSNNSFGDGVVIVKCNTNNGNMIFGNNCRFDGRINTYGDCAFGDGSQILGTINVYNCTLRGGGAHTEPDPGKRAGLLKGIGTTRGLTVEAGMVLNGFGPFDQMAVEPRRKLPPASIAVMWGYQ